MKNASTKLPDDPAPVQASGDSVLWENFRQDDPDALVQLYERLYFPLMSYGLRICHDPEISRDAINDVFLELWDRRAKLPRVDNVRSYLLTYLRRKIMWGLKAEQKSEQAAASMTDNGSRYESSYEDYIVSLQGSEEMKQRVHRAMAGLTPRQKEIVELRYFEGLSMDEIAEKTGISAKTAYNTLGSALKALSAGLLAVLLLFFLSGR
ncbi:RNA polymerase sigma factor [Chitinophaga lutea]